ncbi:short-chain dehydrogenase [Sporosarcina trichiuri]|uniref:short-chain dehydrogenase n=1 Tax=Sporosarcina trichiuri TaxID=3056445 RepID=UPI0025B38330|nr:short-chain dehydrogenase [Sporosarcina sp. 0.2-SM1T-5]WJY28301.1 short-chain dehydrogenase [Sporosarcina sp. 0.2-SM1T-5]
MKHALVVGGTGMLAGVSRQLAADGYHVSVLARNAAPMDALLDSLEESEQVTPLLADYRDSSGLRDKTIETIQRNGPIDMAVAWIHSDAAEALPLLIRTISKTPGPWKLFQVISSGTDAEALRRDLDVPADCRYSQIQLGSIRENGVSRWLTHQEISQGVLKAIAHKAELTTIGQLGPREDRP